MYFYRLERGSKKYQCPKCGKSKVYTRYMGLDGNYAAFEYGYCDKINSCGYHKPPSNQKNYDVTNFAPPPAPPIKLIPEEVFQKTLGKYELRNNLFKHLCGYFKKKLVEEVFNLYRVGSSKKFNGSVVFWYINATNEITRGKIIAFDSTGHRVKKPYPQISSAHKELSWKDFEQKKCLFGEHLLPLHPTKTICIVESEKTALICALFSPKYLWLACGSASQLNESWLKGIKNRNVILYPDRGMETNWENKVEFLQKSTGCKIKISNILRNKLIAITGSGEDIADLILESIKPTTKPEKSTEFEEPVTSTEKSTESMSVPNIKKQEMVQQSENLKHLIKKNPNVALLIDKLGLEETQRTSV